MTDILTELRAVAKSVNNRYIFGGSRAPGYDCSGSVWQALRQLDPYGMATVKRFYTWNLVAYLASNNCKGVIKLIPASQHKKGDLVLWDGGAEGHVGVCTDSGDNYFSFYNTREGAKDYKISQTLKSIPHRFYRYTVATVPASVEPAPVPASVEPAPTPTPAPAEPAPAPTTTVRAPLVILGEDVDTITITYVQEN